MSSAELFLPCAIAGLGLNNLCAPAVSLLEQRPCWLGWDRCCPAAAGPTAPGGCDPTALAGTGGTQSFPGDTGSREGQGQPVLVLRGVCARHSRTPLPGSGTMTPMRASSTAPVAPHGTGTSPPHPWAGGSGGGDPSLATALNSLWKSKAGNCGIIQMKEKATSSFSTRGVWGRTVPAAGTSRAAVPRWTPGHAWAAQVGCCA